MSRLTGHGFPVRSGKIKERKKEKERKKWARGFLRSLPLKNPREVSSAGAVGRVRDWWGEGPGSTPTGHNVFLQKLHLTSNQDMGAKKSCTHRTQRHVYRTWSVSSQAWHLIYVYIRCHAWLDTGSRSGQEEMKERKKEKERRKWARGFLRGLPLKNPREVSSVGAVGRVRHWWGEGPGSTPTGHKFFFKNYIWPATRRWEKKKREKHSCTHTDTEACGPYLIRVQSSVTPNTYVLGVTLDWTRVPGQVRKKWKKERKKKKEKNEREDF